MKKVLLVMLLSGGFLHAMDDQADTTQALRRQRTMSVSLVIMQLYNSGDYSLFNTFWQLYQEELVTSNNNIPRLIEMGLLNEAGAITPDTQAQCDALFELVDGAPMLKASITKGDT